MDCVGCPHRPEASSRPLPQLIPLLHGRGHAGHDLLTGDVWEDSVYRLHSGARGVSVGGSLSKQHSLIENSSVGEIGAELVSPVWSKEGLESIEKSHRFGVSLAHLVGLAGLGVVRSRLVFVWRLVFEF